MCKGMKIEDFGKLVAEEIRLILGSEYSIEYKEVSKNNGVLYHALVIRKEEDNIAPTIYIDGYYESYVNGKEIEEIAGSIINLYEESMPKEKFDASFFTDFSAVCEHLSFKVTNYEKNKDNLTDVPYKKVEDLALVPICLVSDHFMGEGSITIKNSHLRSWEVSFDELWENVWENAEKTLPVRIRTMSETLEQMGNSFEEYMFLPNNIFVVSNTRRMFGAATVFYPGVLENLAEKIGNDFVVLPSSVHEAIVMPVPEDETALFTLVSIVKEVNRTVICSEDYLSDNVYRYSVEEKRIWAINDSGVSTSI